MSRNKPRAQIVVAASDFDARAAVVAALRPEPSFAIIGEASDKTELLELRQRLQPDILLVDAALASRVNGAVTSWPDVRVILLANAVDQTHIIHALRLAARAIVPLPASPEIVVKSIRTVLADQYWLGPDSISILLDMLRQLVAEASPEPCRRYEALSPRELHVVSMIAGGLSNKQIGEQLAISERTVKHHLTSIFGKLGLSSRLQLAHFAVANKLTGDVGSCVLSADA